MILKLFLTGDVMLARGVDQVLPVPSDPRLFEPAVSSAHSYVEFAESQHGPIPKPVPFDYVWGAALDWLDRERPHARIINLETSVTKSDDPAPKGINYRMNPGNVPVITAARVDCCVLSNNHVLDWQSAGLAETLDTLEHAHIQTAGAGRDLSDAEAPAVLDAAAGARVLVFGIGATDSGIPPTWSATSTSPGIHLLRDFSANSVAHIARLVQSAKRAGDIAVASIHWGDNWGYDVPTEHEHFARALIDHAAVDVVHGHSSHHPMAIQVYRDRPILYGCGDFINDYEGIPGFEQYRADLVLMYFVTMDSTTGRLVRLDMIPLQVYRFRLRAVSSDDRRWMRDTLERECNRFGHKVIAEGERLTLRR